MQHLLNPSPTLLFLHGFLGMAQEWLPLCAHLPSSTAIHLATLPGHANLPFPTEAQTDPVAFLFRQLRVALHPNAFPIPILIGYSAGGRLALELKRRYPSSFSQVIVFSAHPGGYSAEEREERKLWKEKWLLQLRHSSFSSFLSSWYEQSLFSSLSQCSFFPSLIKEKEIHHHPSSLALFFNACMPPSFSPPFISFKALFAYGEFDLKYRNLSRTLPSYAPSFCIEGAGHAIHLENPQMCAELIRRFLS